MIIESIYQDNATGKKIDVSDLICEATWETVISDQPGKLTFKAINDGSTTFKRGSALSFQVDTTGVFFGYVFNAKKNDSGLYDVTCYDQMRYLQNKDLYVIDDKTASQVFEMICQNNRIPKYKIVTPTSTIIPPRIHDNVSMFDIINWGIDYELINNKQWYMLRDNFGTLEFTNIEKLAIPPDKLILSDSTNINSFEFEASIDKDTYNQVKIMQENRESKKGKPVKTGGKVVSRDYGFVNDETAINQWGLLQYFEKSNKHLNQAQLDLYAKSVLSQKNRETTNFQFSAIGDLRVVAGSQVFAYVDQVKEELKDYHKFLVTAATHRFKNNEHGMDLQVYMPQFGMEAV